MELTAVGLEELMEEAVALALRGRGEVEPNPRVGALALQDGEVVGRGWHRWYGSPHAELEALEDARRRGGRPDTVVITLEPCSSEKGVSGKKTPPCTRALAEAGVRKVVIGTLDPDPRHHGRGVAALEDAGIEVQDGVLTARCREINRPFERALKNTGRPWTIAKWAMTLDGKTAASTGESRWISGKAARTRVHLLRSRCDAVAIGFRTARTDDPLLTVRHVQGPTPVRILVDPCAETDERGKLISSAREVPLWMLVATDADRVRVARLERLGVTVIPVKPAERDRRLHMLEAWRELRRRGMRRILVEGGGGLMAQLLAWGCVDQLQAFVAPKIIGGQFAPTPVGGDGRGFMAEAWRFREMWCEPSGEDLMIGAFTE